MQYGQYNTDNAIRTVQYGQCNTENAIRTMQYRQCNTDSAIRTMQCNTDSAIINGTSLNTITPLPENIFQKKLSGYFFLFVSGDNQCLRPIPKCTEEHYLSHFIQSQKGPLLKAFFKILFFGALIILM